ncbi:MAG: hypothetical protein DRO93_10345 [Candidatus Thorarchaeota archaeon]|nr:MAG: hypothetical protein DRO93_10345 [Candidatus Thorarchaeota archaeon]
MEPISRIDVQHGKLYFRGLDATELASAHTFESVFFLLTSGRLPSVEEETAQVRQLCTLRSTFCGDLNIPNLTSLAERIDSIAAKSGSERALATFVACMPVVVAASWQASRDQEPVPPSPALRHVPNLAMMLGIEADRTAIKTLEFLLILQMDDPDNPSLTALNDTYRKTHSLSQALRAALESHEDPIHHGAGHQVMRMIEEVKRVGDVRRALESRLDRGERIYGIGHRIYRTIDPRAVVLRRVLESRVAGTEKQWLAETIEEIGQVGCELLRERKGVTVYPNVDLYNAAVVMTLGLPPEMNTQLFAVARSAGWAAHLMELSTSQS